jgi:hypothetical protein
VGNSSSSSSGGIGFLGALTLVFVLAKLAGWVTWSWWLVFAPVLIVWGLLLFVLFLFVLTKVFSGGTVHRRRR